MRIYSQVVKCGRDSLMLLACSSNCVYYIYSGYVNNSVVLAVAGNLDAISTMWHIIFNLRSHVCFYFDILKNVNMVKV